MSELIFDEIERTAAYLKLNINAQEIADVMVKNKYSDEHAEAISGFLLYLKERRHENLVNMLQQMSRIPFKNLASLSSLYAHKNLAFIGPQGVGKTHLAMAYGSVCCENEFKAYFLKATELNQKFTDARRLGRESAVINNLVNPACLIIDEIGRCVFDKENTRMFFDVIDRRYSKEGPNNMIFTSNKTPDKWGEFFGEDSSLLCALDRIFDDALVFMIKGNSYRGQNCKTVSITAGELSPLPKTE